MYVCVYLCVCGRETVTRYGTNDVAVCVCVCACVCVCVCERERERERVSVRECG